MRQVFWLKNSLDTRTHNYKRTLGNVKNSKNMNNIFIFQAQYIMYYVRLKTICLTWKNALTIPYFQVKFIHTIEENSLIKFKFIVSDILLTLHRFDIWF